MGKRDKFLYAVWNAAEPSGGMAADVNLDSERFCEAVEVGLYNTDGWVRFLLPVEFEAYQGAFDKEQRYAWEITKPGFPCVAEARLEILPFGRDVFNSVSGVIAGGPVGDFSFITIVKLHLEGVGWRILDTEMRADNSGSKEPIWLPLHRRVVAIVPRVGKSPLVFQTTPDGELDERGLHFVLDGENRELAISHLSRAVLTELGWLRDP
ncbi:MAG: hypothetical protein FJZ07_00050 [Candidatus Nealsonbacteria bacterium]|nr:hypothetical protein [Candidatus Nealsonbacteria bacterium]